MLETYLAPYADITLLFVRLIFGAVFLYFGIPKIRNLKKNASDFESMGFKPGWLWGTPIAFLEVFGSVGVILGIYTTFWALLFALHMITGTIWKITKTDKKFPDWSYDLLLLALALVLLVVGPGIYTLL